MKAVIVAGGKGERLMPYTKFIPKVLMPLGDKTILEILMDQLIKYGCEKIYLALGHDSDFIKTFVEKRYNNKNKVIFSTENNPLGNAGHLKLLEKEFNESFIVMNGDVIADIDFKELFEYHKSKNDIATIAVFNEIIKFERGVINLNEENNVEEYIYRPSYEHYVSTGIYAFKPEVLKYINSGEFINFDELMKKIMIDGKSIGAYKIKGNWIHLRKAEDYEDAIKFYEKNKDKI